jgi:hypothetical protein
VPIETDRTITVPSQGQGTAQGEHRALLPSRGIARREEVLLHLLEGRHRWTKRLALSKTGDAHIDRMRQVYDKRRKLIFELVREVESAHDGGEGQGDLEDRPRDDPVARRP